MLTRPPSLGIVLAFEAAARYQSFAKAADELSLSRSAISHAVGSLEERLGARLFSRVARGVVLTQEGARLAAQVRASLAMLTDALDRRPLITPRRLCIGVESGIATRLLAPRLADFARLNPTIAVELRVGVAPSALASGEVDLILCSAATPPAGPSVRMIAPERLFPVAAPSFGRLHELSGVTADLLIESREHPWALWFASADAPPRPGRPGFVVETDAVAIDLARSGLGVCLAPGWLVRADLESGDLVRLTRAHAACRFAYFIVWNPASPQAEEVTVFAAWLTDALASIASPGPSLRVVRA